MTLEAQLQRRVDGLRATPSVSPIVVMKFGSSVLVEPDDAPKVASDIYAEVRKGRRVVAVVSAFSGETDRLLGEAGRIGLAHENHLLPAYVVQGEERSAALVAVACDRIGLEATTLTVRELGIIAEGRAQASRPTRLNDGSLRAALERHDVVVVPGFGAVSPQGRTVLLGRGGSDLTAVFLADELGLDAVQLIKDVDGLYDRDPNVDPDARRYDFASWMEARALAGSLVQPTALELAENRRIRIEVRNYLDGHRTVIGPDRAPPRPAPRVAPLRVAIAGCGVVGGGALSRLLVDPRVEVTGVLVRDPGKPRDVPGVAMKDLGPLLVSDPSVLLQERPDILIEALSEADAGHALVTNALTLGIDVVSASKQVVSRDPAALLKLAAAHQVTILWSAAVGGGTPMVEALRSARDAGPVEGFEAVLNGTVNFLLERLDAGEDFDVAMASARAAGFAEEDASADLDGLDALAKVRLLAFEAFGVMPEAGKIRRDRLQQRFPPRRGTRQVSRCWREGDAIHAEIRLKHEDVSPQFRSLAGERNALHIQTEAGSVWRFGRGAGRWATAEAVLADLSDIAHDRLTSAREC